VFVEAIALALLRKYVRARVLGARAVRTGCSEVAA
jgi:hypothetical protein